MESPRSRSEVVFRLSLLGLGVLGSQLGSVLVEPQGLKYVQEIVRSPTATSYFTDALQIDGFRTWMKSFPPTSLALHSSTHPPGPIVYYFIFIHAIGAKAAPVLGAAVMGIAVASGVFLVFAFTSLWTQDLRPRILACCYYSLIPGLTVFFPEFDQLYPLVTMGMLLLWARAIETRPYVGALVGLVYAFGCFFAYNMLVLGCLPVLWTARMILAERKPASYPRLLKTTLFTCLGFLAFYAGLSAGFGYRPIHSFFTALHNQHLLSLGYDRPYFPCVLLDPYDFLMGFGMCSLPLLIWGLDSLLQPGPSLPGSGRVAIVFLLAVAVIDATGLLRAETSRVWMFLYPLLLAPVSIPMETLGVGEIRLLLASEWSLLVALKANLAFLNP